MIRRPPRSPPFPYTALFRSLLVQLDAHHLRQPVVARAHEGEDEPAHDRVVEVRHHEEAAVLGGVRRDVGQDRNSTRLNSSHANKSYADLYLKKISGRFLSDV